MLSEMLKLPAYGMKQLTPATSSIIAIHGLQGDPAATWTESTTKKFWLKDFLPTDLSSARIMTFGYNADVAFSKSTSDIDDHTTSLLNCVVDKREGNGVGSSILVLRVLY